MGTTTEVDTLAALAADFPHWHVWRGRSGPHPYGWYATRDRRRRLSGEEFLAGLFRTLAADDPQELRDQLRQQEAIETRRAEDAR